MKDLLDEVLDDPLFISYFEKISYESEKDVVKENIEIMLKDINSFYMMLMNFAATESGIDEMAESIEYLITDEGIKEWQEKS